MKLQISTPRKKMLAATTTIRHCKRVLVPSLYKIKTCRSFSSTSSSTSSVVDITDATLGLTEDALAYYTTAADFASKEMAPYAAKWDEEKIFPMDTLRAAAKLGFGTMYVSPDFGGSGLGRTEGVPVVEALAAACPSTAAYLTIHNMVAAMLDKFGSTELKERYLPRMATLDIFSSYCLTEPGSGSDAASLQTSAILSPDKTYYTLNGSKAFISGGGTSDIYIVMARTGEAGPGGISAFVVENKTPGLSFGKQEKKMGWNSQPTAAVFFDNVKIPINNLIGEKGQGFKYAMIGLDGGRLSIAACSVGAANACFNIARDYVKVRKQFGKPLSSNQTVQFSIADMASDLYLARSVTRSAAALFDSGAPTARTACAMAKRVATQKGFEVCDKALQLHGGYGYLKDYPIERYVRDVRVHKILEGTNEIMNSIISRSLLQ
jgi:alkylation response protein AidB-like acyl-CoA dehydrogenase